nr:SMC-Scp complex subunit ScpB [Hamadaea sp.]
MTQDGSFSQDSLADQAASWVPPWQRPGDRLDVPADAVEHDAVEHTDEPVDDLGPEEPVIDVDPELEPDVEPDADSAVEAAEPEVELPIEHTEPVELPDIAVEPEAPDEEPGDYTAPSGALTEPAAVETTADEEADPADAYAAVAGRLAALVEMPKYDADPIAEPRHTLPSPQLGSPVVPAQASPAYEAVEETGETEAAADETQLAALDPGELRSALEAILMVVDEPVGEIMLAQVLEQPTEVVADALLTLAAAYTAENRGFELRRAAGGWRFYTRDAYASYVERFVLDGQSVRLTQAALETLAVVAYKQPVTRSRISAIRGVNCDGVVRTLVSRGLIEECGAEPDSGAHLYRTTSLFLEKLGLDGLDQLPPLAPFLPDNIEEIADAER